MSSNEPFRSRPRIRRKQDTTSETPPPEDDVIEGEIEEEYALVPMAYPPPEERQPVPAEEKPRRRRRLRPSIQVVDPALFVLTMVFIIGGIFFTLLNVSSLPENIERWYPGVMVVLMLLWAFIALVRRDPTAFLGGTALAGFSFSLLLQTQDIAAFEETFVGLTLIATGIAVMVRGLLLRQRTV